MIQAFSDELLRVLRRVLRLLGESTEPRVSRG
jgi:hypothetical protein